MLTYAFNTYKHEINTLQTVYWLNRIVKFCKNGSELFSKWIFECMPEYWKLIELLRATPFGSLNPTYWVTFIVNICFSEEYKKKRVTVTIPGVPQNSGTLDFCYFEMKKNMAYLATMYGSQKSHYPWLKCHEHEEKIDNDYVLRNDHRIKTTQPISMILVSFFSEDNVLSDEIKLCDFEYQSNENQTFRSFFGTPGICDLSCTCILILDMTKHEHKHLIYTLNDIYCQHLFFEEYFNTIIFMIFLAHLLLDRFKKNTRA